MPTVAKCSLTWKRGPNCTASGNSSPVMFQIQGARSATTAVVAASVKRGRVAARRTRSASVPREAALSTAADEGASNAGAAYVFTVPLVTVGTSPSGNPFTVDGFDDTSTQTLYWIPSSTHTITCATPSGTGSQCTGWSHWPR